MVSAQRTATMRHMIVATLLGALIPLMPMPAAAESHQGVVQSIRIDSEIDAAFCVATDPNMPGGAWACLYRNRPHYLDMRDMLLRALDWKHICTFEWTQRDALTNRVQISS